MKFYSPVFICFILFSLQGFSQRTIKGNIVNGTTGEPVPGCSVFINSTSLGTTADKSGYFELNNVPPGRYELIFSSIGYETKVVNFTSDQLPLNLRAELKIKVKELETVTVEPWVEEGWDKWGKLFMDNFIGSTSNASQCRIRNEDAIHFRFYKKSNRVIAYSDEPLIIENRALGYNIRYQLEQFEINFKSGSTVFAGYPFFEEINRNRKGLQRRWKAAREKAFNGSIKHFIRSLYNDSLEQNGYEVRRLKRLPNYEKERVRAVYRSAMIIRDTIDNRLISRRNLPKDSIPYYESVLRQKDYTEIFGSSLLKADSLIISSEGQYKLLYFNDWLFVTYKMELEDDEYLHFSRENRKPVYQRSYIWLVNDEPVAMDMTGGYYPPLNLYSMAYWAWSEKIAELLPSDYQDGD